MVGKKREVTADPKASKLTSTSYSRTFEGHLKFITLNSRTQTYYVLRVRHYYITLDIYHGCGTVYLWETNTNVLKITYLPSPLAFCTMGPADKNAIKTDTEKQKQMWKLSCWSWDKILEIAYWQFWLFKCVSNTQVIIYDIKPQTLSGRYHSLNRAGVIGSAWRAGDCSSL